MPKPTKATKTTKSRTQVKKLPKGAEKLKADELKNVKGGKKWWDMKKNTGG